MRTVVVTIVSAGRDEGYTVYNLSGGRLLSEVSSTAGLSTGIYIINGKKTIIAK